MKNIWIVLFCLLIPVSGFAGVEVTGVVGTLLGDDLGSVTEDEFSVSQQFENAPLYGARLSYFMGFLGVEGSFVTSPNGLEIGIEDFPVSLDTRIRYLEANVLFVPLPGQISPFITAGIGRHSFDFDVMLPGIATLETDVSKSGYNFGGGLRVVLTKLVIRGDVRDHVTKIGPADFDLEEIAEELGFNREHTLHNIEISVSAGIRF